MKPSEKYSQLRQSDDNLPSSLRQEVEALPPNRGYDWTRRCLMLLLGMLGAMTFLTMGYIAHPNTQSASSATSSSSSSLLLCGNTSSEARSLGCVFDLLTNNWMPHVCADPFTDNEYRAWVAEPTRELGTFAFYHDDGARRQVASEEELSDSVGKSIWTTTENHLAHCVFLARRMHRLVTGEISAVAHNTFTHTMHCTDAVLKALDAPNGGGVGIGSTFDVGIVSCLVDGSLEELKGSV